MRMPIPAFAAPAFAAPALTAAALLAAMPGPVRSTLSTTPRRAASGFRPSWRG